MATVDMKHVLSLILVVFSLAATAQQTMTTSDDYLRKGRRQETIAWVLAGSGVTMIAAGTVLALNTEWGELDYDDNNYGRNETIKAVGAVALLGTGIVAVVGSVPLFIISSKNKRKAASISFSNQQYRHFTAGRMTTSTMPSIGLSIRL